MNWKPCIIMTVIFLVFIFSFFLGVLVAPPTQTFVISAEKVQEP